MRGSLARCLASLTGAAVHEIPLPGAGEDPVDAARPWLAERALGLVPVRDPAAFQWPGPWIATHEGGACTVRFGVPSGPVHDPDGAGDAPIAAGWLLAPLDVALWRHEAAGDPGTGVVEALLVAPRAEAPVARLPEATAVAGRGLEGDRYERGDGTFGSGRPGSALTLVAAEDLDDLGVDAETARRNVVTRGVRLDALVGRRFAVGDVVCEGRRLCEPCAPLDRLAGGGVLRALVHRGGLRADIVQGGTLRPGDAVRAL